MAKITISGLTKSYSINCGIVKVLDGLDVSADTEQITVIVGKSGCGKTTLLRLICGLEQPDSGSIDLPDCMKVGMVFQEARLMPWLTCERNISFGLGKGYNPKRIQELIKMVGLEGFEEAYPVQLSGGMQQRSALARTLAMDCSLILMDEPFAALDYFTRATMQKELLRIKRVSGTTMIFVTHNIEEALILGDTVLVMASGRIAGRFRIESCGERDILSEQFITLKRRILAAMS